MNRIYFMSSCVYMRVCSRINFYIYSVFIYFFIVFFYTSGALIDSRARVPMPPCPTLLFPGGAGVGINQSGGLLLPEREQKKTRENALLRFENFVRNSLRRVQKIGTIWFEFGQNFLKNRPFYNHTVACARVRAPNVCL